VTRSRWLVFSSLGLESLS